MKATFVTLIPKEAGAKGLNDHKPISLIGGVYKIIAKLLTERPKKREKYSVLGNEVTNVKSTMKPIIYFQTWRVGILFFAIGNCLNFVSFGYAAQSLLAALGSIQFVSNIAFAYFVLNKTVTINVLVATAFIVLGNIFLVAFGNHQSPVNLHTSDSPHFLCSRPTSTGEAIAGVVATFAGEITYTLSLTCLHLRRTPSPFPFRLQPSQNQQPKPPHH
ncbi:hypothetical protein MTR67_011099 [Solanum verrucosum]|uniref:Probable magnesium transporter n=1 Tax=Solanum verrucosum TaxID=315347 RepID=A0AAF0Q663_SOLVR|nr:hypothetical protein MTR67_011099 [Solanum verrucosum]